MLFFSPKYLKHFFLEQILQLKKKKKQHQIVSLKLTPIMRKSQFQQNSHSFLLNKDSNIVKHTSDHFKM